MQFRDGLGLVDEPDLVIEYRRYKVLELFLIKLVAAEVGRAYLERLDPFAFVAVERRRQAHRYVNIQRIGSEAVDVEIGDDHVKAADIVDRKR